MEPQGLPFDRNDLAKINTNMLMMVIANQHAMFDVISSHLNIPQEQLINEFNALVPKKTEAVLALLYRQFGMTPDVLL